MIDRLELKNEEKSRFTEGIEKALRLAEGLVVLEYRGKDHLFRLLMACPACQIALPEMEPRLFLSTLRRVPVRLAMVWGS